MSASRGPLALSSPPRTPPFAPSPDPRNPHLSLLYPFPLPVAALLDLAYTINHCALHRTPHYLLILAVVRAGVLGVVVGGSRRWRGRGAWVGVVSGLSMGIAVWEVCQGVLMRGRTGSMGGVELGERVHTDFLAITAGIAAMEYLLFLLLLRLSPVSRRQPLPLRLPSSATTSARPSPAITRFTPSRANRSRRGSMRSPRSHTHSARRTSRLPDNDGRTQSPSAPGSNAVYQEYDSDGDDDEDEGDYAPGPSTAFSLPRGSAEGPGPHHRPYSDPNPDFDLELESDHDLDPEPEPDLSDVESASSVSTSSIIDLPPPLEPSRIVPPSLSMQGLSIGTAIDSSPVLGPLIRRTRSARFLGRSWGSQMSGSASGVERGMGLEDSRRGEEGYGTFWGRA